MHYFEDNYYEENSLRGWENFIKFRMPATNNCLEALNRTLKVNIKNC